MNDLDEQPSLVYILMFIHLANAKFIDPEEFDSEVALVTPIKQPKSISELSAYYWRMAQKSFEIQNSGVIACRDCNVYYFDSTT